MSNFKKLNGSIFNIIFSIKLSIRIPQDKVRCLIEKQIFIHIHLFWQHL